MRKSLLAAVLVLILAWVCQCHAEPMGTVTIRYFVPPYDETACDSTRRIPSIAPVTVVVMFWSWRTFVFTFQDSTRGIEQIRQVSLPVGFYIRRMRSSDPGGISCWTEPRSTIARVW